MEQAFTRVTQSETSATPEECAALVVPLARGEEAEFHDLYAALSPEQHFQFEHALLLCARHAGIDFGDLFTKPPSGGAYIKPSRLALNIIRIMSEEEFTTS